LISLVSFNSIILSVFFISHLFKRASEGSESGDDEERGGEEGRGQPGGATRRNFQG